MAHKPFSCAQTCTQCAHDKALIQLTAACDVLGLATTIETIMRVVEVEAMDDISETRRYYLLNVARLLGHALDALPNEPLVR